MTETFRVDELSFRKGMWHSSKPDSHLFRLVLLLFLVAGWACLLHVLERQLEAVFRLTDVDDSISGFAREWVFRITDFN
jgi:hypothetical protein